MGVLDLRHDPEAFRAALRNWLEANVPADWAERVTGVPEADFVAFQKSWLAKLDDIGLATPHWREAWGGHDLSLAEQVVIAEEMARAGAPDLMLFVISLFHLPATLAAWGTQEQIDTYLPGVRDGTIWCQGFSEPGAGSDLASLRTRAVRDGDRYIINGQKVWSSFGAFADYYLLLARTDPDAPKHKGISCFIVDMTSPGITIRPIRQINGQSEFCEVFLDDVSVPAENLVGPENEGWAVAQSTLSAERGVLIFNLAERMHLLLERLMTETDADWHADDQTRRELVRCYADLQSTRGLIAELLSAQPGDEALVTLPPVVKLLYSETLQRFGELMTRVSGLESQVARDSFIASGFPRGEWMTDYLSSWALTISGGANEILRNIISERHLGLPREPK